MRHDHNMTSMPTLIYFTGTAQIKIKQAFSQIILHLRQKYRIFPLTGLFSVVIGLIMKQVIEKIFIRSLNNWGWFISL